MFFFLSLAVQILDLALLLILNIPIRSEINMSLAAPMRIPLQCGRACECVCTMHVSVNKCMCIRILSPVCSKAATYEPVGTIKTHGELGVTPDPSYTQPCPVAAAVASGAQALLLTGNYAVTPL